MDNGIDRLLDALAGLVWTALPNGRIAYFNQGWLDYTGLAADGVRGTGWQCAVHAEDLSPLLERWNSLFQSAEPGEMEARLRRSDGEYRWFLFRASPRDVNSGSGMWCGLGIDIDDRRQAEQRSRIRENRFRMIVDGFPAVVSLRTSAGDLEHVNQQFVEYSGATLERLQATPWHSTWHPADRAAAHAGWQASLESGSPWTFEGRRHRKDGVYRWFQTRGLPLRDADGHITLWYLLHTDIDDRRRAEALLAGEKQLLEMVARGHPLQAILEALCRHFESTVSGCACSVVLVDPGGTRLDFVVGPSLPAGFRATVTGQPVNPESNPCAAAVHTGQQVIAADLLAQTCWAEPWNTAVQDHGIRSCWSTPMTSSAGTVLGAFAVYHDQPSWPSKEHFDLIEQFSHLASIAVERERSDDALAKARSELAHMARVTSLGLVTASMAHEVNQPLSGIITNASTCLRMLATEPPNVDGARETARRTIRDGNRAADVIGRLRALFSKTDGRSESVDLNEATREVVALSSRELQQNRVAVETDLADGLPRIVGDRVQLQQVILNLVLNAVDAMDGVNGASKRLSIKTEHETSGRVRLTVTDSGIGVDTNAIDRLFDAFYTTKVGGMGIGLSVSRSIIDSHRGRLWATSNDGPGATFGFSLPGEARSSDLPPGPQGIPPRLAEGSGPVAGNA